ncbi:MAG: hypothetical protein WCI20_12345 [bacterium]
MTLKKGLGLGLVALAVMVASDCVLAATATPESIIVMPARKRIVHLAFQIARLKDVGLVTYNNSPTLAAPLIHIWSGQEWVQITPEDFQQGAFMSGDPRHVFILGDDNALPAQLASVPNWAKNAETIKTLDTASLVNQFGKTLNFSSSQWRWIAEVNGLSIKDQNAERRRYGRWGAPGKEVDLSPAKLESDELPPGPIMTSEPKSAVMKGDVKVDAPKAECVKTTEEPKVEYKIERNAVVTPVSSGVEKPTAVIDKPVIAEPAAVKTPAVDVKPVDPTSK